MSTKKIILPQLLQRKIYKTGQTRGADDDVIYQNRVNRNNTVLIPYMLWRGDTKLKALSDYFENGYIVLINPEEYFNKVNPVHEFSKDSLIIGRNCLVFYQTREDWIRYNPEKLSWKPATSRMDPLGGQFVARVPATTSIEGGVKINHGFNTTELKGAGIRQYEYAHSKTIKDCQKQLEAIFWMCFDAVDVVRDFGMTETQARLRKDFAFKECEKEGLLDYTKLKSSRIIDSEGYTICPLCLDRLSGSGFFNRLEQAAGRRVPGLTVTEINLFHINELVYEQYNHKSYNLGWGCHHCNVVTKDAGIENTLLWMQSVLERNKLLTLSN